MDSGLFFLPGNLAAEIGFDDAHYRHGQDVRCANARLNYFDFSLGGWMYKQGKAEEGELDNFVHMCHDHSLGVIDVWYEECIRARPCKCMRRSVVEE